MCEEVITQNLVFSCLDICFNTRLTEETYGCFVWSYYTVLFSLHREIPLESQVGVIKYCFLNFFLFVSNKGFIWCEGSKFFEQNELLPSCPQNREPPSMWKSYQEVPLCKEKEEWILCEEIFVNKNGIHQSMETNITKLCMH